MAAFARAATAAGSGSSPSPRGAPARQAHRIRISGSEISQLILRRRGRADLGGVSLKCSEPTRVADSTASSSSPSLPAAAVTSAVEVRVYNIDRYGMSPMASRVLKKEVDGIYHVGITAFGNEYWYDHQINQIDLASVEYCFGFGPAHTYGLGTTSMSQEDFEEWLYTEVKDNYTIDKYDCFYHNCHHFANELALRLTGGATGIPQWCIDHGEKGLEMLPGSTAERYRAASNKIARIMMVCWGRYNQQRFKQRQHNGDGA